MDMKGARETKQLWISPELHRRAKIEAARRGTNMRAIVEKAIEDYLEGVEDEE